MKLISMRRLKKPNVLFNLILVGILYFSITPTALGFIAYEQQFGLRFDLLMQRVHNDHLNISYGYGDDCPAEEMGSTRELEQAITDALQLWLEPLRALQTTEPIVNDFRYTVDADIKDSDLRVTFHCAKGISRAELYTVQPPSIFMHKGTEVTESFMHVLVHEIGHTFGLADIFVGRYEEKPSTTTGGLKATVGKQPPSAMSFHLHSYPPLGSTYLSEDDKRGIVWLYKLHYEGLQTTDCFFVDYMFEEHPRGCYPKYPLIFETKYGNPRLALRLLDEDPTIDVNAQDEDGMTALHYATQHGWIEVVQRLLAHQDINPSLKDKQERTPLDIARAAGNTTIINMFPTIEPPHRKEDVNSDGEVNIFDLIAVAQKLGQKDAGNVDVNADGTVDIRDLVLVAEAFGTVAAAPTLQAETHLTAATVAGWLSAAQKLTLTANYARGLRNLQNLHSILVPSQTALLANYPNPFNPETWIPYQLANPANVTLSIYAADGKVVRTLKLGSMPAGTYQSRSRAAHWDGKNALGEPVASGVYFYTLKADDFTSTRKMLIRK